MPEAIEFHQRVFSYYAKRAKGVKPPLFYKQRCVECGRYYVPVHAHSRKCSTCRRKKTLVVFP